MNTSASFSAKGWTEVEPATLMGGVEVEDWQEQPVTAKTSPRTRISQRQIRRLVSLSGNRSDFLSHVSQDRSVFGEGFMGVNNSVPALAWAKIGQDRLPLLQKFRKLQWNCTNLILTFSHF